MEKYSKTEIADFVSNCQRFLRRAARGNWNQKRMDQELSKLQITEEQQKVVAHVWKNEGPKIHKEIVSKTVWNSSLEDVAWRIDVKANSKHIAEINDPTAIIRLNLKTAKGGSEVVHCEMDKDGLSKIIKELDVIQDAIDKVSA